MAGAGVAVGGPVVMAFVLAIHLVAPSRKTAGLRITKQSRSAAHLAIGTGAVVSLHPRPNVLCTNQKAQKALSKRRTKQFWTLW